MGKFAVRENIKILNTVYFGILTYKVIYRGELIQSFINFVLQIELLIIVHPIIQIDALEIF